jgi:hypothetical protein
MVVYNAYNQIAELIAKLNPAKVMALKANKELQNVLKVWSLNQKNQVLIVVKKTN